MKKSKIRGNHSKITAPEFLNVKESSLLPLAQAVAKKG